MKHFLGSPAARRTAWITLVAFVVGLGVPVTSQRAEAQAGARTAYLVPFVTEAEGVVEEVPLRLTSELAAAIREYRGDPRVKAPLDLLSLNLRDPIVRQAIADGDVTEDEILNPPTAPDEAFQFAQSLGLTTVLVGVVDGYLEAEGQTSATLEVTVTEYYIPSDPNLPPSPARVVSKTVQRVAANDREKVLLRTDVTRRAALEVAAALLQAPEIVPPEPTAEQLTPTRARKPFNALYAVLGVIGAIGLIFLISTATGSSANNTGGLGVNDVRAVSLDSAVRVTWTKAAGAIGYNVYRRVAGNQPIRSARATGFELLLDPATNTSPTVPGGGREVFIDNSAVEGVLYEYAVAGVGTQGQVGALSTPDANSTAGSSIGLAPTLSGSAGDGFVALNWTASDAFVTGYVVFRRQGGVPATGPNSPDELTQVGAVTRFDDLTVTNGLPYTYVVQPITLVNGNQQLTGIDSNPISLTANAGAAPQAPRNVEAEVDAIGQVRLTWSPNPEDNIDTYEILRRRDTVARSRTIRPRGGSPNWIPPTAAAAAHRQLTAERGNRRASRQSDLSNFTIIASRDASITNLVDGPLPDGTYTYAVRAVNTAGSRGPATLSEAVTVNAPLAAPGGLTATGLDRMVRLDWQAVAGDVEAYNVYRSSTPIDPSMTSPATAPGIALVGSVAGNTTRFTDTGLPNNTTFFYAVTSVDSGSAESEFGKGGPDTADTGVVGIPHAAPVEMEFSADRQNISGNGISTAQLTVQVRDSGGAGTGGVQVQLTTDQGEFAQDSLPANAQFIDDAHQQVLALTDLSGRIQIDLQSAVVTQVGQQLTANVQAVAAELPDAVESQSETVSFLASRPTVILLTAGTTSLTADNASTTDITARVLDALGEPVPSLDENGNLAFDVQFSLQSTNGAIRIAGPVAQNPFVTGNPAEVDTELTNGEGVAVYRAGNNSTPGQNVIPIVARARDGQGTILQTAQTLVTLVPGSPAQIRYLENGVPVTSIQVNTGASKTISVEVRDAQGNLARAGVQVQMSTNPSGVITAPTSGTTDGTGRFDIQVTGGANPGGAVLQAGISGTQVQANLAVQVN